MKCASENLLQLSLMDVTYASHMRFLVLILLLPMVASAGGIYTRDGVTDGDTFYLAPSAFANDDPAFQAWVAYSLMKSACQLQIGGENPARASSFDCEYKARKSLVDTWDEKKQQQPELADDYLDDLSAVRYAGFLAEYTTSYFGKKSWTPPEGLRSKEFKVWRKQNLRGHRPRTRIIGSWNYKKNVASSPF